MTAPRKKDERAEFYTAAEVAAKLDVGHMTIYRMAHADQIPGAIRLGPRMFRFHIATFDAWLAEQVGRVTV